MNPSASRQSWLSSAVTKVAELLVLVVMLLLVSLPLFSQGSQGTIQGAVFDSTGGAMAGATVTVLDIARGTTRTLKTDESGQYAAPALTTGTYMVRAQADGFTTVERNNVLLEVSQNVRVDLTLSPGAQTQTVTVTEEVPAINTTSATLGGTVSNQEILSIPLIGRNFLNLLDLRPGVVGQMGSNSTSRSASATSTNGRRSGGDMILVEGITQFDMATNNNLINGNGKGTGGDAGSLLSIDAIQEFSTQQGAQAEYGWKDGSVINVGIKSGTNRLHGTGYAFGRDAEATDAANFFTGTVTPATTEQFGGTMGGPIIKNKLFWFVGFEGLRVKISSISQVIIPTDIGQTPANPSFSMVDACNAIGRASVTPLSAQLAGLTNPASCTVSQQSASIENVFPYNPTTSATYYPGNATLQPLNNGLAKGDWNINERNHLSGFYYDSRATQHTGGALQPYWARLGISKTQEIAGSWTFTANSAWVNAATLGWAGVKGYTVGSDVGSLPSNAYSLGPSGIPTGYGINTGVTTSGFPAITFTSGIASLGSEGIDQRGPQGQLNAKDAVSYLRGNHSFKFGFEYIWIKFDNASGSNVPGTIIFANLTNFLLGTPDSGSVEGGNTKVYQRESWYAGFVEDTWRIAPRVTLTPGLRYEYMGPPHDINNFLGTFNPNEPGGVVQVGPGLPQSKLYNPEKADFQPRIGVAWDIRGNGRTVLRSGISRLSSSGGITTIATPTPYGANLPSIGINRSGTAINKSFSNPLSFSGNQLAWNQTGPIFPLASAAGPSCTVTVQCSTGAIEPNWKRPKSIQWNVDVQRAITSRLTLDVAYIGVHGYEETNQSDLNAVPVGTGWDPATVAKCLANAANCKVNSAAITAARPYNAAFPYYNYIVQTGSGYHSNYNGLQVSMDSRNFHGLSFLTAYTYSHALDEWSRNSQGQQMLADPANPQLQYASGDQDVRHRFRFSPTWAIPGKKAPGQILEGWSVSGVLAIQGRFPWTGLDSTRNDFLGTGENLDKLFGASGGGVYQVWNFSGPTSAFNSSNIPIPCFGKISGCTAFASAPADIQTACTNAATAPYSGNATVKALALQSLANNACYIRDGGVLTPPAYGTVGNAGRNSFRGPHYRNVDLSISKNWHFGERYSAQFRTEFFNLFNQPTFGPPGASPPTASTFGFATSTPDSGNPVLGTGGPRHIQFGLKLAF